MGEFARAVAAAPVAALVFALPAAAAQAPSIKATPVTVGSFTQVTLAGTTGSTKAGETVYVQAKECGVPNFHVIAAPQSVPGGSSATSAVVEITTSFRARVGSSYSRPIVARKRAPLTLSKVPNGRIFLVRVFGGSGLVGRTVRIERHTVNGWVLVQRAKLRRSPISGVSVPFGISETNVRIKRRDLLLRARLMDDQARPCFVGAASEAVRS